MTNRNILISYPAAVNMFYKKSITFVLLIVVTFAAVVFLFPSDVSAGTRFSALTSDGKFSDVCMGGSSTRAPLVTTTATSITFRTESDPSCFGVTPLAADWTYSIHSFSTGTASDMTVGWTASNEGWPPAYPAWAQGSVDNRSWVVSLVSGYNYDFRAMITGDPPNPFAAYLSAAIRINVLAPPPPPVPPPPPPPISAPPTVTLSADPTFILVNETTTLSWIVSNDADVCLASGDWIGSKSTSTGSEARGPLTATGTYTYVLTCFNSFGSGVGAATVVVGELLPPPEPPPPVPPPPSPGVPLSPNPCDGCMNVSVFSDLDWSDTAYTDSYDAYFGVCPATPLAGNTITSGWNLPTLNYSTIYCWQIVAKNFFAQTFGALWTFTTEDPPAPICALSASKTILLRGQPVELSWSCGSPGGIDSTTLYGIPPPQDAAAVAPSGNKTFIPQMSTEYTVRACNTGGCGVATVNIGVYIEKIIEVLPTF